MQSITPHITITDGITWQANQWLTTASGPHQTAAAKTQILQLIALMPDEIVQSYYIDSLCTQYKWKATETKKQFTQIKAASLPNTSTNTTTEEVEIDDPEKFPKWAMPYYQQWKDEGFICALPQNRNDATQKTGIYYINRTSNDQGQYYYTPEQFSNFVITPIMHVYNGPESLFIFKIQNHMPHKDSIIEVPAGNIPSPELFQKSCIGEGNFMIYGGAAKWKRIAGYLLEKMLRCYAIEFLGWQHQGFFAYVNGAYIPGTGWQPVDENGLLEHNKEMHLIPASSQVYLQTQGRKTDAYESDRTLILQTPQNPLTLSQWAHQMHLVYDDKAPLAIAALAMALFRDILFAVDNNCPLLYFFGEPSSGKSKMAESIGAVFYRKRTAFNVNSGTDFAFFSYLQRFINTIAHLNEVDEATLKPEWFQALKGAYDGESRERGRIVAGKVKTEIQKIQSLIILTGQKLITADDNSLVTRSLIHGFSKKEKYTDKELKDYNTLKQHEEEGLTYLLPQILQHRQQWQQQYKENINNTLNTWRRSTPEARAANNRILLNWAHAATSYTMLAQHHQLPVPETQFNQQCMASAIHWSKFIAQSDTLAEFWATIQNLANTKQITEGWDYQVSTEVAVNIEGTRKELQEPQQILFLRIGNIHPLYEKDTRSRGKTAMTKENIMFYLSSRTYFLGSVRSKRFHKFVTMPYTNQSGDANQKFVKEESTVSCHAFIYQPLNIEITNNTPDEQMPF